MSMCLCALHCCASPITSVLPKGVWFIVMNSGLFLHVIVTYQIMVNVWSASLLEIVMPR